MNKLTKATIAASVGIALLLGGAGTFATWNSSSTISGGTIVSGNLLVGTPATGTWTVAHLNALPLATYGTPVGLTMSSTGALTVTTGGLAYTASPGDQLTYTTTVPLTVTGTNLSATLALTQGAITAASSAKADGELASDLSKSANVTMGTGAGISSAGSPAVYTISGAATSPVTATLAATITFPSSATDAMNGSVSFAGWALALTQTS